MVSRIPNANYFQIDLVGLGVMAIKVDFILPRSPELEIYYKMQFDAHFSFLSRGIM